MRFAPCLVIVAILALGCTASVGKTASEPARPVAWEYRQDRTCMNNVHAAPAHDRLIAELLDVRGREAWELVSITPSSTASETCYLLIFKRESMK